MRIEKLDISTIRPEWFAQIVNIENNCGLEPYSPQMLHDCITDLDTFAYFEDDTIVGFITVHPSTRYLGGGLYIVNLNVALPYRRQGIGRKLLLAACNEYAISHYGSLVTLDVCKTNTAALALYGKLGFTVSDLPSANGNTDIVMTASLNRLCYSIKTERLIIKPLSPKDVYAATGLLRNRIINQTYMLPDLTKEAAGRLFYRLMDLSLCADHYVRGIYLEEHLIGFINDTEIEGATIELGWVLHPDHHNYGYATEAVSTAIKDLLSSGYTYIMAGAFAENCASIRVMQKAGMQLMDKTELIEYRGQNRNCVYYGIGEIP